MVEDGLFGETEVKQHNPLVSAVGKKFKQSLVVQIEFAYARQMLYFIGQAKKGLEVPNADTKNLIKWTKMNFWKKQPLPFQVDYNNTGAQLKRQVSYIMSYLLAAAERKEVSHLHTHTHINTQSASFISFQTYSNKLW